MHASRDLHLTNSVRALYTNSEHCGATWCRTVRPAEVHAGQAFGPWASWVTDAPAKCRAPCETLPHSTPAYSQPDPGLTNAALGQRTGSAAGAAAKRPRASASGGACGARPPSCSYRCCRRAAARRCCRWRTRTPVASCRQATAVAPLARTRVRQLWHAVCSRALAVRIVLAGRACCTALSAPGCYMCCLCTVEPFIALSQCICKGLDVLGPQRSTAHDRLGQAHTGCAAGSPRCSASATHPAFPCAAACLNLACASWFLLRSPGND